MTTRTYPVAARMRRPGWKDPRLVAGLVLIAVAVAGVVMLLQRADTTAPHFAARVTLAPGDIITADDVVVANVRVGDGYLNAPDATPVGQVVARTIGAGELIPASALSAAEDFNERSVAVTVTEPLSASIEPGAIVDVWVTPEEEASMLAASGATVAQVVEAAGTFGRGGATVYVVVPAEQVGSLLDALHDASAVVMVGAG